MRKLTNPVSASCENVRRAVVRQRCSASTALFVSTTAGEHTTQMHGLIHCFTLTSVGSLWHYTREEGKYMEEVRAKHRQGGASNLRTGPRTQQPARARLPALHPASR